MKNLKDLFFFTGAGGFYMGMHEVGFDIKLCAKSEEKNK